MTLTIYSTASTARRALKNALAKIDLTPEMVLHEIAPQDGKFIVRVAADIDGFEMITIEDKEILPVDDLPDIEEEVAPEEAPKPKKGSGYIRGISTTLGPTKLVWAIADSMVDQETGERAARKDVLKACHEAGITYGTARTQYQQWLKATKGN